MIFPVVVLSKSDGAARTAWCIRIHLSRLDVGLGKAAERSVFEASSKERVEVPYPVKKLNASISLMKNCESASF